MIKTALVTGITGQDGAYLSKLLLKKGYNVNGTTREISERKLWRLEYLGLQDDVNIHVVDLLDIVQVQGVIRSIRPDEIYNLAALSSVSESFVSPAVAMKSNVDAVSNILEAIVAIDPNIKFYQASSSEVFGNPTSLPVSENTSICPVSPYGVSKAIAHMYTRFYREYMGLYAVSGFLFNHESELRENGFFLKKVVSDIGCIAAGIKDELIVGNLDIVRDFGDAEEYVDAMWKMLQQEQPNDYVVCIGKGTRLEDIVQYVLDCYGVSPNVVVRSDSLTRPNEIYKNYGTNDKAFKQLGWMPKNTIFEVIDRMVKFDQEKSKAVK